MNHTRRVETDADADVLTREQIIERVRGLNNAEFIIPHEAYVRYNETPRDPPELSAGYGDWETVKKVDPETDISVVYMMPAYCSGSDYSGALVEMSNHRALLETFPDDWEDGREYISYHGGYSTYALAIRLDALTDGLLEMLEALENYPLIDEDLHSHMEMDAQNDAWESMYRSDFKTELGKAMFSAWESSPVSDQRDGETDADWETRTQETEEYLSDECGEMTDATVDGLFYRMAEYANEYWANEQGGDCYIDVERVVSRGLEKPRDGRGDWAHAEYERIRADIRTGMSDRKYDLGIMPYVDPNQLTLGLETETDARAETDGGGTEQ